VFRLTHQLDHVGLGELLVGCHGLKWGRGAPLCPHIYDPATGIGVCGDWCLATALSMHVSVAKHLLSSTSVLANRHLRGHQADMTREASLQGTENLSTIVSAPRFVTHPLLNSVSAQRAHRPSRRCRHDRPARVCQVPRPLMGSPCNARVANSRAVKRRSWDVAGTPRCLRICWMSRSSPPVGLGLLGVRQLKTQDRPALAARATRTTGHVLPDRFGAPAHLKRAPNAHRQSFV
jgi:hypothetical protein